MNLKDFGMLFYIYSFYKRLFFTDDVKREHFQ